MKNKFIRFSLGGAPGAILGYIILFLYTKSNSGISFLIQVSIVAFFIKEILNFIIHKWWTFKKLESGELFREILLYFFVTIFLTFINTILFYGLIKTLNLNSVVCQGIINSFSMFVGYLGTKEVFNGKK